MCFGPVCVSVREKVVKRVDECHPLPEASWVAEQIEHDRLVGTSVSLVHSLAINENCALRREL